MFSANGIAVSCMAIFILCAVRCALCAVRCALCGKLCAHRKKLLICSRQSPSWEKKFWSTILIEKLIAKQQMRHERYHVLDFFQKDSAGMIPFVKEKYFLPA